jgi:hypothetical protein
MPVEPGEIISTEAESTFQQELKADRAAPNPGPQMEKTANDYMGKTKFVLDVKLLALGKSYTRFSTALQAKPPAGVKELTTEIKEAFKKAPPDLVNHSGFMSDRKRLGDSLIAAKFGTPPDGAPLSAIAHNLRLIALIERVAAHDIKLAEPGAISRALDAGIVLPPGLLPLPDAVPARPAVGEGRREDEREKRREEMRQKHRELSAAHSFLQELRAEHYEDIPPRSERAERTEGEREPDIDESLVRELRDLHAALSVRHSGSEQQPSFISTGTRVVPGGTNLMVRRQVLEEAPANVRAGLRTANLDLASTPVTVALERLITKLTELIPFVVEETFSSSNVVNVGGQLVRRNDIPDLNTRPVHDTHGQ